MQAVLRDRMALPGAMFVLLLLSLAYWWLENLAHEIFGTGLFLLLAWHITVNRMWFLQTVRAGRTGRRLQTALLHVVLILNMLVLLVTSVVISKSVFASLSIPQNIYLRDVHWFSAYWVMMFVGLHVGLHWSRIMGFARVRLGLRADRPAKVWCLRITALLVAVSGLWSFSVLDAWNKLTFTYSLEFWDFTSSVAPFFGHWAGLVALPAVLTHYIARLAKRAPRRAS